MQISIDPNEWSTAFYKPFMKYITWVQDHCMEKSYTKWLKLGKICRKYQQKSIHTWVKYSSQCPHCNENNSKSTVWTNYIPSLIKTGQETYKTPALYLLTCLSTVQLNPLMPNNLYKRRTAQLTSRRCILCIYSTNMRTEYFKHAAHSPFFPLQNAVYFIILSFLVPVLLTF